MHLTIIKTYSSVWLPRKEGEVNRDDMCVYIYHLLKSGEVNGDGALISSGTKRSHSDVGDGRNHHERGEIEEKNSHK